MSDLSEMGVWIKLSEKKPKRRQLCDFLAAGDEDSPLVWMLCSAQLDDVDMYSGAWLYWRPAEPLPPGVCEYDENNGP